MAEIRNVRVLTPGEVIPEGFVALAFDPNAEARLSASEASYVIASTGGGVELAGLQGIKANFNVYKPRTKRTVFAD